MRYPDSTSAEPATGAGGADTENHSMMHTGIALTASGGRSIQLCVAGRRVQISSADGKRWSARTRRVRIVSLEGAVLVLSLAGQQWVITLDDPDRFRWQFLPRLRSAVVHMPWIGRLER